MYVYTCLWVPCTSKLKLQQTLQTNLQVSIKNARNKDYKERIIHARNKGIN